MSRTTDAWCEAYEAGAFEGQFDPVDDRAAEFEHEAAEDCAALAAHLTRAIDSWGFKRVKDAIFDQGYELQSK